MIMSILIENMEMPKSCFQCWNYDKINAHAGGWCCVLTLTSYGCNPFKRPAWCPLKEVKEGVEELEELKECPFCGGKAILDDCGDHKSYFVRCKKCGINQEHLYHSKVTAIKAWNRRVLKVPEKWGDNI